MSSNKLPEDLKIQEYEQAIEELSAEIAAMEEQVSSEKLDMDRFSALYFDRLGRLFYFNDMLSSAIVREKSRLDPDDADLAKAAAEAEEQLRCAKGDHDETADEVGEITPELKAKFREAIKMIHPDRATDDADREYRTGLAQQLNDAYRKGDALKVETILRDFQLAEMPDNAGKRLIVLIRQDHDMRNRLVELQAKLEELRSSELAHMRAAHQAADALGQDLFADASENMVREISENAARLARLGLVPIGFKRV